MINRIALATAAAVAFLAPASAMAAQQLTISGALTNGNENAGGPFGPANNNLAGSAYTVTLSYDPGQFASGGNSCGAAASTSCSFAFSATRTATETVTVNGYTQTYTINAGTLNLNSNGTDQFGFSFQNQGAGLTNLSGNFTAPAGSPNAFFPNQNSVNVPVFSSISNLTLSNVSFNQSGTNYNLGANATTAQFSAQMSAVPEPATWATMLAGVGALGLLMRRGRRARSRLAVA